MYAGGVNAGSRSRSASHPQRLFATTARRRDMARLSGLAAVAGENFRRGRSARDCVIPVSRRLAFRMIRLGFRVISRASARLVRAIRIRIAERRR